MKSSLSLHQAHYIITAAKPGEELVSRDKPYLTAGTVQWVSQLAFEPLLIGVSIGLFTDLNETIDHSGSFTLHLLENKENHRTAVKRFSKESIIDQSSINDWPYQLQDRALILEGLPYYHCTLRDSHRLGDHTLHIGEVIDRRDPSSDWQALHTSSLDLPYRPQNKK